MNEKTPQEQKEFADFVKKLDSRNFIILPSGEPFHGSAVAAKHRALELLKTMQPGDVVRVVDSTGTIFCQEKR